MNGVTIARTSFMLKGSSKLSVALIVVIIKCLNAGNNYAERN